MRIKRNDESDGENDWITTYSDMVTLLLAFFVLLFSFSEVDAVKWKEIVKSLSGKETIIFKQESSESIMDHNTDNIADFYDNKGHEDEKSEAIDDEEAGEETAEEVAEETVEEPTEEVVEEPAEEVAEEPVEEVTEEPVEEVAKEPAEEVVEEPVEEVTEEPVEETIIKEEAVIDDEQIIDNEEVAIDEEVIIDEEIIEDEEIIDDEEELLQQEFDELYNDLVQYNENENMNSEIMKSKSQIVIRLPNSILFEPGEADISSEALESLKKLAKFIKKYDEVVDKIITEGNTDNIPTDNLNYRDNFELSLERSLSVLYFFKYDGEFKPEKLIPIGYGENNPLEDNDTVEGRAKNRRTDIVLVKKKNNTE